jgi:hypothetical protein
VGLVSKSETLYVEPIFLFKNSSASFSIEILGSHFE